ncbi:MAG: hypothetical protein L0387_44275 [Acidobacteria bacterium]|nr:hypothetical protein [Acidobacteriota bacterium]MCI0719149.1 hypothetical protein [Acidobacteriota bacterium]
MNSTVLRGFASVLVFMFCARCAEAPKPASAPPATLASAEKSAASATLYDLSKEDITKIPGITSRNITVEGVKLGDRTRDVDKLLGNPIKTETLQRHYRSAYRNHGIYIEIDKFAGKVTAIYVNTNYYKQAKGALSDLLAYGKMDLLKQSFGENPVESKPEVTTTVWSYPDKGIQLVHIKQEGTASYTLKLVAPKV